MGETEHNELQFEWKFSLIHVSDLSALVVECCKVNTANLTLP